MQKFAAWNFHKLPLKTHKHRAMNSAPSKYQIDFRDARPPWAPTPPLKQDSGTSWWQLDRD
jgi:hypothetical protein